MESERLPPVPRILVITTTFPKRPDDTIPRFILDMTSGLANTPKNELLVICPSSKNDPPSETWDEFKVTRFRYMLRRFETLANRRGIVAELKKSLLAYLLIPPFLLAMTISVFRTVKRFNPDVVIANWVFPCGSIAAMANYLLNHPTGLIVSAPGGDAALVRKNALLRAMARFAMRRADRIIAYSTFVKNHLADLLEEAGSKTRVIPMGVSDSFLDALNSLDGSGPTHHPTLLFVGRLEEKKGVRYLIEAMPTIIKRFPEARLDVVGDGGLAHELRTLATQLDLGEKVAFHGSQPHKNLPKFLQGADIFVSPSINTPDDVEGMPTTILEALAAQLPVVATDAGGVKDVIKHTVTGLIVKQADSSAISDAVIELLTDEALRAKIAKNVASLISENHTFKHVCAKYQAIIDEITGE